jgi:polyisoprenoid-binding protein YceI
MLGVLCAVMLTACQTPPHAAPAKAPPATASPTASLNGKRYVVDPQVSEIRLLVYRDGPMARVGHNHVMVGQVQGELSVSDTAAASGFRIEIPVESLQVDAPAARTEEGEKFAQEVSDQARKGTRDNMLGADVLDAAHYPVIRIDSVALKGPRWNPDISARITVRGKTSNLRFTAAVIDQIDTLTVIAAFRVRQSDLGIKPYSILGGAVTVRDAIDIRVRLVARSADDKAAKKPVGF